MENKIVIARYPVRHVNAFAHIAEHKLADHPLFRVDDKANVSDKYAIGWGSKIEGVPGSVMETGFFWEAAHLDTLGMYSESALNTDEGYSTVLAHKPRPLLNLKSKYTQTPNKITWEGVVLACQNPGDRSIRYRARTQDYWNFIEGACQTYGTDLFIKLHPWNSGPVADIITQIADKYKVRARKCDHSVIAKCKFVLAYNSTFLVDCMIMGIKAAAFVPSAFSRYAHCTNGTYPSTVPNSNDLGQLFVNFLAYKYCFNYTMTAEKTLAMFEHFSNSTDLFPMTDEYCYALNPSDPAAKGRKH
jgi:hypothetical protein